MRGNELLEKMELIDPAYIEAADGNMKKKKASWKQWGVVAACFVAVAAFGAGLLSRGVFGSPLDIATLNTGEKIVFVKSDFTVGSLDLDVIVKPLTKEETVALFSDLPVTANAIFTNAPIDEDGSRELLGLEGHIGNVKMLIATSTVPLLDTMIIGREETSEINGITIAAGYFVTNPNSKGVRNAVYYATFEMGGCKVYLENGGMKDDCEALKNQLAEGIQKLIENGEVDVTFLDGDTGTGFDGDNRSNS